VTKFPAETFSGGRKGINLLLLEIRRVALLGSRPDDFLREDLHHLPRGFLSARGKRRFKPEQKAWKTFSWQDFSGRSHGYQIHPISI